MVRKSKENFSSQIFPTPESAELPKYSIKLTFFCIMGTAVLRSIKSLPAVGSDAANFHSWTQCRPDVCISCSLAHNSQAKTPLETKTITYLAVFLKPWQLFCLVHQSHYRYARNFSWFMTWSLIPFSKAKLGSNRVRSQIRRAPIRHIPPGPGLFIL